MVQTVGELKMLLSGYNPEMKLFVLTHAHEGKNGLAISKLEFAHTPDGLILALVAYQGLE